MSQLAPYIWALTAILVVIIVFIVVRFFWQHVLKYLLQGCLVIAGIIVLLIILRYFNVF